MRTLKIMLLIIPLMGATSTGKMNRENIKISELGEASNADLQQDFQIPILTSKNQTKRASFGSIKSQATCETICGSLLIPSAQVQTIYTNPVELIPAQGAGKVIQLIDASVKLEYQAPAYTLGNLMIISGGATIGIWQAFSNDILFATSDKFSTFEMQQGMDSGNMEENQPLYVAGYISNPLNGNSDIKIYYRYRVLTQ